MLVNFYLNDNPKEILALEGDSSLILNNDNLNLIPFLERSLKTSLITDD